MTSRSSTSRSEIAEPRARIPVDHVVVAVDQALLVEVDEDLLDRLDVALVEREALVLVVARGAQALELLHDRAPVLLAPLPDAALELLAARAPSRLVPSEASSFSTWAWVAMPAWSVPKIHFVRRPFMRLKRISTSWIAALSAWPMCSAPVTFGGGIAIE